ncbi:MAG: hypothetical protein GF421_02040 [Candidatus Aminicenantes bacterium]|nr:hypothetical protein [Candidatus Aminicenantes bacterium]
MKPTIKQKKRVCLGIFSFSVLLFFFFHQASAQSGQKLFLNFNSSISYQGTGAYGTAGVETKSEGYAYLNPHKDGTFSGTGEIQVTITFKYPPNPAMSISPLKGKGDIQVKGKKNGNYMNFWFEHGNIPCKGIITINYPPPMGTEKQDYVDDFDPHTLAPGTAPGWEIELKDGAEKVVDYGAMPLNPSPQEFSGQTTFRLYGIESWRVGIKGEEIDTLQPFIDNPRLKATTGELPISMKFTWNLIVEFTTLGKGASRTYNDGFIFYSILDHALVFEHEDLYRCTEKNCGGSQDKDLTGEKLNGKASGNTVQLQWPKYTPIKCVTCAPRLLGKLGETVYDRKFKSSEFLFSLSSEKLPLEDGKVINRSKGNWMKYKITITKIK